MISERFRTIRTKENLTQEQFGKKLGVSRSVIKNIEYGKVELKESLLKLVCNEFSINELWLRNGTGDMYIDEGLTKALASAMNDDDPTLKQLIELYTSLNDEYKAMAVDIIKQLKKR